MKNLKTAPAIALDRAPAPPRAALNRRAQSALRLLHDTLNDYGAESARNKLALLEALRAARLERAEDLRRLQRVVCFLSAFPDDARVWRAARRLAAGFAARVARAPGRAR
jgi:hypothetical protein